MYLADKGKLIKQTKNAFLKNTLLIWHSTLAYLGKTTQLSQFIPIFGNDGFQPGRADAGFKAWAAHGIAKISDFYNDNNCMSFEELKATYGIPSKHFF